MRGLQRAALGGLQVARSRDSREPWTRVFGVDLTPIRPIYSLAYVCAPPQYDLPIRDETAPSIADSAAWKALQEHVVEIEQT